MINQKIKNSFYFYYYYNYKFYDWKGMNPTIPFSAIGN